MTTTADVPRESACPACGSTTTKHEHLPRVPMSDHPLVVAVFPGIPVRIIEAALEHARAHRCELVMAYVDESRVPVADGEGSVPLIPDEERTPCHEREVDLRTALEQVMSAHPDITWQFRYLAGLTDRELAHLAHTVNAGAFMVGTRAPGFRWQAKEWFDGSVALQLSRRQRRPIIIVPLRGEDWTFVLHANRVGTGVTKTESLPDDQNPSHDEVGTDDSIGEDDAAGAHR